LCYKREKGKLPILAVHLRTTDKNDVLKIPPYCKGVLFRMGAKRNRFLCYAHRFLSNTTFEATVLDRYPREDYKNLVFPSGVEKVIL